MTTPETSMSANPTDDVERQRYEIDSTRADMGRTLERIEDRVSPSRIRARQTERVRSRWSGMKDAVMGSAHDGSEHARERVTDVTEGARDAVQHAPERLEGATRGNPLAAGLIAAGLGALAGSLLPTTEPERRAARQLRDEFEEPIRSELQHAGHEVADELRDHAQQSAEAVKSAAQESTDRTMDEARDSADTVKQEAQDAGKGDPVGTSSSAQRTNPSVSQPQEITGPATRPTGPTPPPSSPAS